MWKKLLLICLLGLLGASPAVAQCDGFCTYLPVVLSSFDCDEVTVSDFKIVIPEGTTNKVLNPSGEITGNFAAEAGTTVTRSTTYQHYGLYSYRVETNANNEGIEITLSALTNAIHYVTVRVRGTLPAAWDWSLDDSTFTAPTLLEQIDANWALYGLQFPAAQANGSTKLSVHQNGSGSGDFYLDGIQVEAKEYWTTYCDGTQEGCAWNAIDHASTSQRSSQSRAGGQVLDLEDDYYFNVGGIVGGGAAPLKVGVDSYAILPGGELNNIKTESRVITLTGVISATSQADFHTKQAALLAVLLDDAYPEHQPVRLRYHGATIHKEIAVYYDGGLEGELSASNPCYWEKVSLRFIAPYPYWQEIGESAALLDTNDSATFRLVAGRLKSTGQWSALGPPNSSGTYTQVFALAEDDTYLYIGGNFLNFDNIANADYIVRYNKQTGAYSALGTGMNNIVNTLTIGPDGSLYAGGDFTTAGGTTVNRIARWDGSSWNAMGSGPGLNNTVKALSFGFNGLLYIGGIFNAEQGGAPGTLNDIASWSGTAYAALGTGMNGAVNDIVNEPSGYVLVAGDFTTAGGTSAVRIARWNGSAFSALGSGLNGSVEAIAVSPNGTIYATGSFTTAGGVSANRVAYFNGTGWAAMGGGLNAAGGSLLAKDNDVYVGGLFTSVNGSTVAQGIARWNGFAWAHLDIDLPGTPDVLGVIAGVSDPVVPGNYDLWLGFDTTGTGNYAGKVTVSSEGGVLVFPRIFYERSGGTTAILVTLRNETTGKELLFSYTILNGERLTIDLNPTRRSIISSFFGPRPDAILANSDFGTWTLQPGSNDITSLIGVSGSPTITAWMLWKKAFNSY